MVIPADWVRDIAREAMANLGNANAMDAALAAGDQLFAELIVLEPEADTLGMYNQLMCHGLGAPDKPSWNLEPWRPEVDFLTTISAQCNP
jgi:hypothetical protein